MSTERLTIRVLNRLTRSSVRQTTITGGLQLDQKVHLNK